MGVHLRQLALLPVLTVLPVLSTRMLVVLVVTALPVHLHQLVPLPVLTVSLVPFQPPPEVFVAIVLLDQSPLLPVLPHAVLVQLVQSLPPLDSAHVLTVPLVLSLPPLG